MKVFLSGMESSEKTIIENLIKNNEKINYLLTSYFYIRKNPDLFKKFKKVANEILVDSGAHSFQFGKKVEWDKYTTEYSNWIKENDCDQILGYFEMDVDNIIGYEKVIELRQYLEKSNNKIIPVWHKNRGINEYKKMCKEYTGKIISIGGFRGTDIKDKQYLMFLKVAKEHDCKVHCLGMTRIKVLNKVPFYSVDSSTWKQSGNYGLYKKFTGEKFIIYNNKSKYKTTELDELNFKEFVKFQKYYKDKWEKVGL